MSCNAFSKLQGQTMKREEDRVVWKDNKKGVFFVRGLCSLLDIEYPIIFLLNIVWNSWSLMKMSFFTWEASLVKVLILDMLQKRGLRLVNICALC